MTNDTPRRRRGATRPHLALVRMSNATPAPAPRPDPESRHVVFCATADAPAFGIATGDRVVVNPRTGGVSIVRHLPAGILPAVMVAASLERMP